MVIDGWHEGELAVQDRLGYTAAVASAYTSTRPVLTEQHMLFHSALPFLAVGTLDSQGRPWGSFLARDGHNDFIECSDPGKLIAKIKLSQEDPLRHTLKDGAIIGEDQLITAAVRASGKANGVGPKGKRPIGAVGIMFHNRRRNKFAGWVRTARLASKDDDEEQVELELDVDQSLGNCPKYINVRHLEPCPSPSRILDSSLSLAPGEPLPKPALLHIAACDLVYLSTRYISHKSPSLSRVGLNHRGGRPGFVRAAFDPEAYGGKGATAIYLPDYSGNRLMQSLGNIATDPVAGLTFPLFRQGQAADVLYLTGEATLLFGDEAGKYIPRCSVLVRVRVQAYVLVQGALPLSQRPGDPVEFSPYDPPVRSLRSEIAAGSTGSDETSGTTAALTRFVPHAPELATFHFESSTELRYLPGQHAIIDCGALLDGRFAEYKHMNPGGEKELNDDGVRSWTISSAPPARRRLNNVKNRGRPQDGDWNPTRTFSITLRRVESGAITPKLYELGSRLALALACEPDARLTLPLLGIGGDFVLPRAVPRMTVQSTSANASAESGSGFKKLLWIASGIGITPFLSMLRGIVALAASGPSDAEEPEESTNWDVHLVLASRKSEVDTMLSLVLDASIAVPSSRTNTNDDPLSAPPNVQLHVHILCSLLPPSSTCISPTPLSGPTVSGSVSYHAFRLGTDTFTEARLNVPQIEQREVYLCGTPAFEKRAAEAVARVGVAREKIREESFGY